jgi:hypothetical protein
MVLIGEPTHIVPDPNGWYNSSLAPQPALTFCFSAKGDYLQPILTGDLAAGQKISGTLTWIQDIFAATPNYRPRILSGKPSP